MSHQAITPFDSANVYTIKLPQGMTWRPELAQALTARLSFGRLILRIVAEYSSVKWQIVDVNAEDMGNVINSAVLSVFPDATIEHSVLQPEPFEQPFHRAVIPFTQNSPFVAPILYPEDLKRYDPLIPLSNLMGDLLPGERFIYCIYIGAYTETLHQEAEKLLHRSQGELLALHGLNITLGMISYAATKSAGQGMDIRQERYEKEIQQLLEEKVNDILLPSYMFAQVDTLSEARTWNYLLGFDSAVIEMRSQFQNIDTLDFDTLQRHFVWQVENEYDGYATDALAVLREFYLYDTQHRSTARTQLRQQIRCVFNPRELATLWHLPHDEYTAPTIERMNGRYVRLPAPLKANTSGVCLGNNIFGGIVTPVHMLEEDRQDHLLIVGKTGMGKSTLIHKMIQHDIRQGRGVAVLDPEGRLVEDILRHSIPSERMRDVLVWDLGNKDYPPPLNPLAVAEEVNRHDSAAELMDIFERIEPKFATTRMASTLSDVLETLMGIPDATFKDMRKLFMDDEFRDEFIESLEDDAAYEFWADYDEMPSGQRRDLITPILHRLRRFYRGPVMQPIMCHPKALDINGLIAENKIILVSLQPAIGARVAEWQQDLLGSIFVSLFEAAASMDAAADPYYLYVDEADRFVTTSIDTLYKRARKRNIHLTLATQYLNQLAGKTLDAIIGNTGAIVAFKCGDPDARALSSYMKPSFSPDDLVQFDRFQAAVFMKFKGQQQPAFNIETEDIHQEATDPTELTNRADTIRQTSIGQYTPLHREEIAQWLKERYPRHTRQKADKAELNENDYRDYVDVEE